MGFQHTDMRVGEATLHVVEAGEAGGPVVLFLHGWPQTSRVWHDVMALGAGNARVIAIDLPGVGASPGPPHAGTKSSIARLVHRLVDSRGLGGLTLVGQDVGGMIAYAYLRTFSNVDRVVIMNTVIPGVAPWDEVLRNPYLWHFAFHNVPHLPEQLIQGHQREYFDYFFDTLAANPKMITDEARDEYTRAYGSASALTAGLDWYRAFGQDAEENHVRKDINVPVLYLRGEEEPGADISVYAEGLRASGVSHISTGLIPGARHFAADDAPDEVWRLIAEFADV